MEVFGMLFVFILPAIAHILAIVMFIMLLGTNKRLEILKVELSKIKQLLADYKQVD